MPWTGGTFTNLWSWVADSVPFPNILASRFDTYDEDQATGINTCLTKDGQNSATANLPMGGFRHTGVGVALLRAQYAQAGQVQDSVLTSAVDSGVADAYVISFTPVTPNAYVTGMSFQVQITNTNTGPCTLNVNTIGAKDIKSGLDDLVAGQLVENKVYTFWYDGTDFQVVNGGQFVSSEFADNLFRIDGSSDATKKLAFEVDGLTTGTVRTLTAQDKSGVIPVIETANILIPGTSAGPSSLSLAEDADNGTNTVTLIAPTAVTTNQTQALPDASGTVALTSNIRVLQVLSSIVTTSSTSTSASWVDIATVTITPSASTSNILVQSSVCGAQQNGSGTGFLRLCRDSTAIGVGTSVGSRVACGCGLARGENAQAYSHSLMVLDSPASTSAITYRVQVFEQGGTAYINRTPSDTNDNTTARGASTITVMEVQ